MNLATDAERDRILSAGDSEATKKATKYAVSSFVKPSNENNAVSSFVKPDNENHCAPPCGEDGVYEVQNGVHEDYDNK